MVHSSRLEHLPPEQVPPLQSESEPQEPHLPLEQCPTLQSESEPQELHWPFEHLLWPLQSESEPQEPHLPLEQCPTLQSESEPHAQAEAAGASQRTNASPAKTTLVRFISALLVRGEDSNLTAGARRWGESMNFVRLWGSGYLSPRRFIDELSDKRAPHWGLGAQCLRALLDSLLVYLPISLMGRVPPTPSFLPVFPTERYFATLVWLTPLVLISQLLLSTAFIHCTLRLLGRTSDFDRLVNLVGMTALVVGAVLVPWDWAWFAIGGVGQYFLGISHLIIDLWAVYLVVLGMKRMLGIPTWLGIALNVLGLAVSLVVAMVFMRSPF